MGATYSRPLNKNELAHAFLVKVLGMPNNFATGSLAMQITSTEALLQGMEGKDSLTCCDNRHPAYVDDHHRRVLRETIFNELIGIKRLAFDEHIKLGKGGAKPKTAVKKGRQAFIISGLPASGKSGVAAHIADTHGAYILDSDYAKRKFPEYDFDFGASLVHEESSLVVFGHKNPVYDIEYNVLEYCVSQGINIVIPKIGYSVESLEALRNSLIVLGYSVHLTLVSLDRVAATKRALERFKKTMRYVPLSLIFDGYANDPVLTYYRVKNEAWSSVGKISTDVEKGNPPKFLEGTTDNPSNLWV